MSNQDQDKIDRLMARTLLVDLAKGVPDQEWDQLMQTLHAADDDPELQAIAERMAGIVQCIRR